jgi:hypothetical protein
MGYLKKDLETNLFELVDDITKIKKTDFKKYAFLYTAPLDQDRFMEQIKQYRRMELTLQMEMNATELRSLGGPVSNGMVPTMPQPSTHSFPPQMDFRGQSATASASASSTSTSTGKNMPINPKTRVPYNLSEIETLFLKFQNDVNSPATDEQSELFNDVLAVENDKNRFVAIVRSKHPNFPKNLAGINIVQVLQEQHGMV